MPVITASSFSSSQSANWSKTQPATSRFSRQYCLFLSFLLLLSLLELVGSPSRCCSAMVIRSDASSRGGSAGAGDSRIGGDDSGPNGAETRRAVLDDGSVLLGYKRIAATRPVWQYMGVPFAKPPVGPRRFRRAEPLDAPLGSQQRPFKAFEKPKSCYYHPMYPSSYELANKALIMWWNNTEMSEDCLYLNVWTPAENAGQPLAVMVWIYGGSFCTGSASLEVYDGAILAAKGGVVVVSMQYRTGPLGFMLMHDSEAPGNMGLTDQLMAMKWVKANIRHFGGDPDQVTLFGESAGAVSVNFHMISPYSQTYFRRAIMQSATAMAWWASENRLTGELRAKRLAESVGCYYNENNKARVVDCLRHVSVKNIQEAAGKTSLDTVQRQNNYAIYRNGTGYETYMYFDLLFRPVFGTDFLPYDHQTVMEMGTFKRTDVLLGVMKDEGVFWIMYALARLFLQNNSWTLPARWARPPVPDDDISRLKRMEDDPYNLVAQYFIHSNNINDRLVDTVAFEYQVPSRRFGFEHWTSEDVLNAFDDLTSDRSFKCPTMDFADNYTDRLIYYGDTAHKVWVYTFNHRTERLPLPAWTGAMHGYELDYIFGMPFDDDFQRNFYPFNDLERTLSEDVIRFWSNFAKTGNPNQADAKFAPAEDAAFMTWPRYRRYNRSHIVLDIKTGLNYEKGANLRRRQCQFWQRIARTRRKMIAEGQWCPTIGGTGDASHQVASSLTTLAALAACLPVLMAAASR